MAANDWAKCPKCQARHIAEQRLREQRVAELYGKIPQDEFISEVNAVQCDQPKETLREDWELGVFGSWFEVEYHAHCNECGFDFSFLHKEQIYP